LEIRAKATPRHVPAVILKVEDIPRTKSGKIAEIAVRDTVHGHNIKNMASLANPEAIEYFKNIKELNVIS
ncbi:acetoacetate--CoA ligase, partial [Amylibacter sp.]|nr:acetoacetate--CoA ligase [Amylibacter sp.]